MLVCKATNSRNFSLRFEKSTSNVEIIRDGGSACYLRGRRMAMRLSARNRRSLNIDSSTSSASLRCTMLRCRGYRGWQMVLTTLGVSVV